MKTRFILTLTRTAVVCFGTVLIVRLSWCNLQVHNVTDKLQDVQWLPCFILCEFSIGASILVHY